MMSAEIRVALYPTPLRIVAGLLAFTTGASLLVILILLLLPSDVPANPLRLIRQATGFCLLPALALFVLRKTCVAIARVDSDNLVLEQRHQRTEIPLDNIVAAEPWLLPLPGAGLRLRLRSGARFRDGLELGDPITLIEGLVEAGASQQLLRAAGRPAAVYARAKSQGLSRAVYRLFFKFPFFALVPTIPLFRVHQLIAYGGAFGEYYQYGLNAYLLGFFVYWGTLTVYLLLYAAALRVPVEIVCAATALVLPDRAVSARRITEKVAAICFYVGVPIFVILRFIPW